MPEIVVQLSEADARCVLDALAYSIKHIGDYPHASYEHKLASLRPVEEVRGKVREAIKQVKRTRTPAHEA